MEQPKEKSNPDLLELHPLHFQNYLEFIYTGDTVINMSNVVPLLSVSSKYKVKELTSKCRAFLENVINGESVLEVLQQLIFHKVKGNISDEIISLEKDVLKNICRNAYTLLESSEFLKVNQDTVITILKLDEIRVFNELQAFNAILRWGKSECARQKLSLTPVNIRGALRSILPYLRLSTMDASDFSLYVASTKILNTDEIVSILLYFNINPSKRHLAAEGNFSSKPRNWIEPCGPEYSLERLSYCGWNECIDLRTNLSTNNWFIPHTSVPHSIRLRTTKCIWITSIGMNCPYDIIESSGNERFQEFEVKVKIDIENNQSPDNSKIIGTSEETIFGGRIFQFETYSIKFENPVYIEENIWHTVYFTIIDSGNYRGVVYTSRNGSDGRFIEYIAGNTRVLFEFENNKSNENTELFTGTTQGFIPTIGFRMSS